MKFWLGELHLEAEVVDDVITELYPALDDDDGDCVGAFYDGRIVVEKGPYKQRAQILLHELAHAAVRAFGPCKSEENYVIAFEQLFNLLWKHGWRPPI